MKAVEKREYDERANLIKITINETWDDGTQHKYTETRKYDDIDNIIEVTHETT